MLADVDFSQAHFVRTQECAIAGSSRERGRNLSLNCRANVLLFLVDDSADDADDDARS